MQYERRLSMLLTMIQHITTTTTCMYFVRVWQVGLFSWRRSMTLPAKKKKREHLRHPTMQQHTAPNSTDHFDMPSKQACPPKFEILNATRSNRHGDC